MCVCVCVYAQGSRARMVCPASGEQGTGVAGNLSETIEKSQAICQTRRRDHEQSVRLLVGVGSVRMR